MMDDFVPFASRLYFLALALLTASRGLDLLSTYFATPNMVLEGNPIAKKLGWRGAIPVNLGICFALAFWPVPAIVVCTASVLVAARNFQSAWLMRSLGEEQYRAWHVERIQETRITLYLFCLAGNTLPTAVVGAAVVYFGGDNAILQAIGMGIVAYAIAIALFTLLSVWRLRRHSNYTSRRL